MRLASRREQQLTAAGQQASGAAPETHASSLTPERAQNALRYGASRTQQPAADSTRTLAATGGLSPAPPSPAPPAVATAHCRPRPVAEGRFRVGRHQNVAHLGSPRATPPPTPHPTLTLPPLSPPPSPPPPSNSLEKPPSNTSTAKPTRRHRNGRPATHSNGKTPRLLQTLSQPLSLALYPSGHALSRLGYKLRGRLQSSRGGQQDRLGGSRCRSRSPQHKPGGASPSRGVQQRRRPRTRHSCWSICVKRDV
eukprot:COSAG03_NODE_3960_length_1741_cov_1.364799_2_plen_252_part_00